MGMSHDFEVAVEEGATLVRVGYRDLRESSRVIRDTATGVEISVRVIPRARTNEVSGRRGNALLVRLTAPPLDGAANTALVALLADRLGIPVRVIHIVGGERSRDKRVAVSGVTGETLLRLLDLPN